MGLLGRRTSFMLMMLLTTSFFLVEIIVGYLTNSMALVADSFHMLSDIISLGVGYFALKFSQKRNNGLASGNTFGWVRAGVLGALINAVFLVALCLSIFISALKRLIETEPLNKPILILVVGCVGLLVNILGIFLFHGHAGHGHSYGSGHGHSHGSSHGHSHGHDHGGSHGREKEDKHKGINSAQHVTRKDVHGMENGTQHVQKDLGMTNKVLAPIALQCPPDSPSLRRFQERAKHVKEIFQPDVINAVITQNGPTIVDEEEDASKSEGHLNMKGVYLHILGDALGSIIVIIAALIVHFVKDKWTLYVDPFLSIVMVLIILYSSVPLLKESSKILLQNVPPHIELKQLQDRLLEAFPEIIGIHEFHVWQLAGDKLIASVHVKFHSNADYNRVSPNLKEFFHYEGIHSTTFQPEFEQGEETDLKNCLLSCVSKSCLEKLCCLPGSEDNNTKKTDSNDVTRKNSFVASNVDATVVDNVDNVSFVMDEPLETRVEDTFTGCPVSESKLC